MEKLCKNCGEVKDASLYYKSKTAKDGVRTYCIECTKQLQDRKPRTPKQNKAKYEATKLKMATDDEYRDRIVAGRKERKKRYEATSEKAKAYKVEKKLQKSIATPDCLSEEHRRAMKDIYEESRQRRANGENVEVDHMIPFNGETISGLHVPWNLQILPAEENNIKSNKVLDESLF